MTGKQEVIPHMNGWDEKAIALRTRLCVEPTRLHQLTNPSVHRLSTVGPVPFPFPRPDAAGNPVFRECAILSRHQSGTVVEFRKTGRETVYATSRGRLFI
jgi:hypothetical protein